MRVTRSTQYPPRILILSVTAVTMLRGLSHGRIITLSGHINRIRLNERTQTLNRTSGLTISMRLTVTLSTIGTGSLTDTNERNKGVSSTLMRTHKVIEKGRQLVRQRQRALINMNGITVTICLPRIQGLRIVPLKLMHKGLLIESNDEPLGRTRLPQTKRLSGPTQRLTTMHDNRVNNLMARRMHVKYRTIPINRHLIFPVIGNIRNSTPSSS